ncbi:hypothetical protein [Pararhizobium haloflavum]|uniref:hypothetical protein n=1 Tax=Pararhizobium haloflavum TaxID=2037914 RepID=UPI000C186692|nr:hypothetical protein [Pararhizobium haloflavum]
MAESTEPYSDGQTYRMRVAYPAYAGRLKYLPRDEHRAVGSLLNRLVSEYGPDVIASAEPI